LTADSTSGASEQSGWADRQLPAGDEVFLDHVGYFVADLDSAGRVLERLGFVVSPVNLQQNAGPDGALRPSGTSNRIARLRRGFLEVLAATHDTPLADQLKAALARYAGLHLIALSHDDVPAQRARMTQAGFAMQPVINLRRHVERGGERHEVRWSVLRPEPGVMPEGRVQFAYCHTPDLTWPEPPPALPNAADGLTDTLLCMADRREAAARFGRFIGRAPVEGPMVTTVPTGRGDLVFAGPRVIEAMFDAPPPAVPFMAGQALRSADMNRTRATIAAAGVTPLADTGSLLCLRPQDALGSALLFHDAGVTEPWFLLGARG
jgi:catechol 2,3-dioxygenase-like lactoylglutathione lyase family enzyme